MYRLELDGLYCTDVVLVIFDKPLYRRLIDSGIVTEYSDCLFLAVVRLADTRPLRPWIAFRTGIRLLPSTLELRAYARP